VTPKSKIYIHKRDDKHVRGSSPPPEKAHTNLLEDLNKIIDFLPEMKLKLDKVSRNQE